MLTERLEFSPQRDTEIFSALPASSGIFLLRSHDPQAEPYVSKTASLRRRLRRLLGPADEHTKKLNLRDQVGSIEYTLTDSEFESRFLLYKVLRQTFPKTYASRLRFRFAPLIKLHLENDYPRASITTRLGRLSGRNLYFGPFQSRDAAEKFLNDSLDFFKMRRCVDDLHPDPAFPGCIYSEMKMCLAPCFKGCSDEEYGAEVGRVKDYLDSSGSSLVQILSAQRDTASADLAFENAAALHAQLEKVKRVAGQFPEILRRIDRLSALIIQPGSPDGCVKLFRVERGAIFGPVIFSILSEKQGKPERMESRIHEALDSSEPSRPISALETMEHLALLRRWYYRGHRIGEIFLADDENIFPMRRIVRGIGRVLKGEAAEENAEIVHRPGTEAESEPEEKSAQE